jgi:hypothetical protein
MGKTGHQQTISYEQPINYQTLPSSASVELNSIYPWMCDKKHGNSKNKNLSGKMNFKSRTH